MRYRFVRTEIWYRWMILSWSHVSINSFDMTFNGAKVGYAWWFLGGFFEKFENFDSFEFENCFGHLALSESNSQPKSGCEQCIRMLFSCFFVFCFENVHIWNQWLFWAFGIVRVEFAAEKCVRTMRLNVVFMNFYVFLGCVMLGCLFVGFSNFLSLSLQATRGFKRNTQKHNQTIKTSQTWENKKKHENNI